MNDQQLLYRFLTGDPAGRQQAFTELVERHVHWIHASAARQVGDAALAEDVTQSTFIVLAQKAHRLTPDVRLTPWLAGVVRLAAKRALRSLARMRRHETRLHRMRQLRVQPSAQDVAVWTEIAPLLDAAVGRLGVNDREAVLLRFYRQLTYPQIAAETGISEAAAIKRVERALEKLRPVLVRCGITTAVGSGAVAAVLFTHTTATAAPIGLIGTTTTIALATNTVGAVAGTAGLTAKGVITMLTVTKIKIAVVVLLIALVVGGTGVALVHERFAAADPATPPLTAVATADPGLTALLNRTRFLKVPVGKLHSGLKIELLGVSSYPSKGKPWWYASGSPLDTPPYDKLMFPVYTPPQAKTVPTEFAFEMTNAHGAEWRTRVHSIDRGYAEGQAQDVQGHVLTPRVVVAMIADPTAKIRFEVAAGNWQTEIATNGVHPVGSAVDDGSSTISAARPAVGPDGKPATDIDVVLKGVQHVQRARRLVGVDSRGVLHPGQTLGWLTESGLASCTYRIEGCAPADLTDIRLQTRPYDQWIEFENIALHADAGTAVQVVTSDDATPFAASLRDGLGIELLGVGEGNFDGTPTVWQPDGTPMPAPAFAWQPVSHSPTAADRLARVLVFRMRTPAPPNALGYAWDMPDSVGLTVIPVVDASGKPMKDLTAIAVDVSDQPATFRIPVAAQPWKTEVDCGKDGGSTPIDRSSDAVYTVDAPSDSPDREHAMQIQLHTNRSGGFPWVGEYERVLATDARGKTWSGEVIQWRNSPQDAQEIYQITGLSADDVTRLQFQHRPFQDWIDIHNISMHSGQKTDVQIVTSDETSARSFIK